MTPIMIAAPREVVDVVYRACRVSGADSGVASMLGRSACFAVGQLGSDLRHVVGALERGTSPVLGFTPVALAEMCSSESRTVHELDDVLRVADLAYAAFSACLRGCSIDMVGGDGVVHSPHDWLSAGRADLAVHALHTTKIAADAGLRSRVESRHHEALRNGLALPVSTWNALTSRATSYLVAEKVIDDAEGQPAD